MAISNTVNANNWSGCLFALETICSVSGNKVTVALRLHNTKGTNAGYGYTTGHYVKLVIGGHTKVDGTNKSYAPQSASDWKSESVSLGGHTYKGYFDIGSWDQDGFTGGNVSVSAETANNGSTNAYMPKKGSTMSVTDSAYVPPQVTTPTIGDPSVSSVTSNSAYASFSVTDNGGATIQDHYMDLSKTNFGTVTNTIASNSGTFTGLDRVTTYYIRANASNGSYRGYSAVKSFTTKAATPTLSAVTVSNITHNSASASFSVTDNGGKSISSNSIELSKTNFGTVIKTISGTSGSFTGLDVGTTYYARAKAANADATGYSAVKSFKTTNPVPTSLAISNLKSYYKNKASDLCISGTVSASSVTTITNYTLYYKRSSDTTYTSKSLGTSTSFELTNLQNNTTYNIYFTVTNSGGKATSSTYNQATPQMKCIKLSTNGGAFTDYRMYYSLSNGAWMGIKKGKIKKI